MRFASHFLALLLAITSIAVPCLAKTQVGHPLTTEIANIVSIGVETNDCKGSCLKAIVTRQNDLDHAAIVQDFGNDLILGSRQQHQYPSAKWATVLKSPKQACHYPVDLYLLCRQLN